VIVVFCSESTVTLQGDYMDDRQRRDLEKAMGKIEDELIFTSMEHRMPPRVMIGIDRDDSAATVTAYLRTRIRQSLAP
jgi:hypothetical protein